jgi:endonuclease/exonuclease/phosphatase family metal-dependent hydrolase
MMWRVMTWNVLGARDPDIGALAAVILERDPDAVAVQELRRSQAARLARRLGWRMQWVRKHFPYSPLVWWRAEGMAIISPHPLGSVVRATLTPELSSWTYRRRVLIAATVHRDGAALRIYDLHLSSESADRRIAQARTVVGLIAAEHPATPAVIAGDLNAKADLVEVLREFSVGGWVDAGGDDTNPSIAPMQRLDVILPPPGATVSDVVTPEGGQRWQELSDHLPVVIEFELPHGSP